MFNKEKFDYVPLWGPDNDEGMVLQSIRQCQADRRPTIRALTASVLIIISMGTSFGLGMWVAHTPQTVDMAWKRLNAASPIADAIHLSAEWHELDGSITGQDNIFQQPPSPAVDAAWNNLSSHNHVWVRGHDLERIGKDPSISLKVPEDYGFGSDAYVAAVDFGHKIHCLNRIRKEIHFNHYFGSYFPDGNPSELHKGHVNHCIYILLQSLMCEASTDFSPFTWYEDSTEAFQDFKIHRKCGNFDGVFQWAAEHQLPGIAQHIDKPAGQTTAGPMDEELLRLLSQHDA